MRRDFAAAESLLDEALALRPDDRDTRFNLGRVYEVQQRYDDALAAYGAILAAHPADVPALLRVGTVRYVLGDYGAAADAFAAALAARPDDQLSALNFALTATLLGRADEAARVLWAAVERHPDDAAAWTALADALRELRRGDEAAAAANAALRLDPENVHALVLLGQTAYDRGAFDEAEAAFARAAGAAPDAAEPRMNLGVLYHGLGHVDEALAHGEAALARGPDDPLAHLNLGMTLLLAGERARGFAEVEWRLRDPRMRAHFPYLDRIPLWDGAPMRGKRLLIAREQGIGDFVLWSRLFAQVRERGATVAVEAPAALAPLYADFPGIDELYADRCPPERLDSFDLHVPLCSLPHILGALDPETVRDAAPYLHANEEAANAFRARFAARGAGMKVGIAWAGEPTHLLDAFRSVRLADFAPLGAVPNVVWISLQKGARAGEALAPPLELMPLSLGPELESFADTAAAIAALDLVIAVDTAVAHVAAAMGAPVWLLHGFGNYWLWGAQGTDSPWYPTLRIFRQHRPNEWNGVFADVRDALTTRAREHVQ
ncbi:MAG: tetratricopeptide repeat protein [Candidatus Eremiobacteraeota bacterium]|nr:tetratricopeptide repeat protein [Candidatus Eremiobacteraeota bacterium]MBV9407857.1 tetratricopeptide repeat protein [Candidatus Eremiobacteraeota bacterium]